MSAVFAAWASVAKPLAFKDQFADPPATTSPHHSEPAPARPLGFRYSSMKKRPKRQTISERPRSGSGSRASCVVDAPAPVGLVWGTASGSGGMGFAVGHGVRGSVGAA